MDPQVVYMNLKYKPKAVGGWLLAKQKPESTKPVQVSPAGRELSRKGAGAQRSCQTCTLTEAFTSSQNWRVLLLQGNTQKPSREESVR